jgi:streptogramin lyase
MPATARERVLRRERSQALRLVALVIAVVAALALALGTMLSAAQAESAGKLAQFRVPTDGSSPRQITQATDGNFWFTESFLNDQNATPHNVGRITPTGEVTEFPVCDFCFPSDIVQGSDGFLYFSSNDGLGRIGTDGVVEPFINTPGLSVGGNDLDAQGSDIWITDFNRRSLWRYDIPTGEFTESPIGANTFGPSDVAVAGNGDVWFSASVIRDSVEQGLIGRLDPATGTVTTFDVDAVPRSITIASDNKVWFAARFTPQAVGFFDPVTETSTVFPADGGPQDIAPAADGSVWFTRTTAGNIARINAAGTITAESKVVKSSEPFGITVAPDGNPWFTMLSADKIATLRLR